MSMAFSRKLAPPIVSAAVAMIAVTSFAIVTIAKGDTDLGGSSFWSIWPISLSSAVAVILVMSFLYRSVLEMGEELEDREATAKHQAMHDQLTGLANRTLLEDRLHQAIGRFNREATRSALLMFDLDRFKHVNDSLGHAAGDILLRQVADRLLPLLRQTDTLARVGGDEFAIVQHNPKNVGDVRRLCGRIIDALSQPFQLNDEESRIGVSIGAVMLTKAIGDSSELMRKADISMYKAKTSGRNCYRIFSDEMDSAVQRRNQIEVQLRRALAEGHDLDLHFQPQLDRDGRVIAVESLLRWQDEHLGELSPAEVIPIAEESGLIGELGALTFRKACKAAALTPQLTVAINLSPLEFRSANLPERLRDIAAEEGVPCERIEIEVTEGVLIERFEQCETAIARLRASGFHIALDDFGTGYSSLTYLRRFQVDKIKLDRSFIDSAYLDRSISIIRAAVSLGHAMGLQVVAEGVSSEEQERVALEACCDAVQGFRYAGALSLAELTSYLEQAPTPLVHDKAA
jgi:diguanylate cyclase (GGDEF)-like protein